MAQQPDNIRRLLTPNGVRDREKDVTPTLHVSGRKVRSYFFIWQSSVGLGLVILHDRVPLFQRQIR